MKPHDEIFREMASDPGAQQDLLTICTPDLARRIDMSTVRAVDASFTGGKQADLLLVMNENDGTPHLVYILVEHKSYPDPVVALQLYRYLGEIWQQYWVRGENRKRGVLPVIHPVVLYHGSRRWTAPLRLTGLHRLHATPGAAERTIVPASGLGSTDRPLSFPTELEYRLVDLWLLKPFRLKIRARTQAFLITLRHALRRLPEKQAGWLVQTLGDLPVHVETRIRLLVYLLRNMPRENTNNLVTALKEAEYTMEGGAAIMTIAQELERRGREKGLREGEEKGRKEGRMETARTVARNLVDRGLSVELVAETTGLTREQVTELQREKN